MSVGCRHGAKADAPCDSDSRAKGLSGAAQYNMYIYIQLCGKSLDGKSSPVNSILGAKSIPSAGRNPFATNTLKKLRESRVGVLR